MAAAKPARPAPIMIAPVSFCLGEASDGGECMEICEDAAALGRRRLWWR